MRRTSRSYLAQDVLELDKLGALDLGALTWKQLEILMLLRDKWTCAAIASSWGVHRASVCRMLRRMLRATGGKRRATPTHMGSS